MNYLMGNAVNEQTSGGGCGLPKGGRSASERIGNQQRPINQRELQCCRPWEGAGDANYWTGNVVNGRTGKGGGGLLRGREGWVGDERGYIGQSEMLRQEGT